MYYGFNLYTPLLFTAPSRRDLVVSYVESMYVFTPVFRVSRVVVFVDLRSIHTLLFTPVFSQRHRGGT